jgi:hypothetical protein
LVTSSGERIKTRSTYAKIGVAPGRITQSWLTDEQVMTRPRNVRGDLNAREQFEVKWKN